MLALSHELPTWLLRKCSCGTPAIRQVFTILIYTKLASCWRLLVPFVICWRRPTFPCPPLHAKLRGLDCFSEFLAFLRFKNKIIIIIIIVRGESCSIQSAFILFLMKKKNMAYLDGLLTISMWRNIYLIHGELVRGSMWVIPAGSFDPWLGIFYLLRRTALKIWLVASHFVMTKVVMNNRSTPVKENKENYIKACFQLYVLCQILIFIMLNKKGWK